MTIQFDEDRQNRKVGDLLRKEEEELVQVLSGRYNVEYISLLTIPVNTDALRLIDEQTSRNALVAAFALIDKRVKVAARNPTDPKVQAVIEKLKTDGYDPQIYIVSMQSLEKAWKYYKDLSYAHESRAGSLEVSDEQITGIIEQAKSLPTVISILENTSCKYFILVSLCSLLGVFK